MIRIYLSSSLLFVFEPYLDNVCYLPSHPFSGLDLLHLANPASGPPVTIGAQRRHKQIVCAQINLEHSIIIVSCNLRHKFVLVNSL